MTLIMLSFIIFLYLVEVTGSNVTYFICIDGTQIKLNQVCDGIKHCPDGSDETRGLCYHVICPENTFRCYYGACINKMARCDGKYQCVDKSDESNCGNGASCKISQFQCSTSHECIPQEKLCNGVKDCLDESDENLDICKNNQLLACPENMHRCKYGGCVKLSALCNGFHDCVDGSDESSSVCNSLKCRGKKCGKEIYCPPLISKRTIIKCESMVTNKKGWVPCNEPLPVGTIAHSSCKPYYKPIYNVQVDTIRSICQSDGTWNREYLKCEPECGNPDPTGTPLIVHGWIEEYGKWPWHTSFYKLSNGNWTFWCGGSLISEKVVITAAHCVWSVTIHTLKAALGKYLRDFDKIHDFTQIIEVDQIIMQPLYQDILGNYGSDVAVVVLNRTVQFSEFIKPVCMDWELHDITQQLTNNSLGMVVGMGITENDTYSDTLRGTFLPVIAYEQCIEAQYRDFKKYVTYTTFCAGWQNGTGVCNGDSGGGLVFPKSTNQTEWVLQGIVSVSPRRLGTSFCNPKFYTIFTKLGMYINWIKNVIGEVHLDEISENYTAVVL